jgi:hypothetical protein
MMACKRLEGTPGPMNETESRISGEMQIQMSVETGRNQKSFAHLPQ